MRSNDFDLLVIGGGPAGMMAAIRAAESGVRVLLVEKGDQLGRKLLITGKGRCNITNTKSWGEFSTHIHPSASPLRMAFRHFSNSDTIDFFNSIGLDTVVERGDRVFPESQKAKSVLNALEKRMKTLKVEILLSAEVKSLRFEDDRVVTLVERDGIGLENYLSRNVIVATGGLSYPQTGSTGDGYRFAEMAGHKIERCFPSLTALMPQNYNEELQGISLKNVGINLFIDSNLISVDSGDLDFTDGGIEGPLGFRVSRKAVKALDNGGKVEVSIDLKPALSLKVLDARIERELTALKLYPHKIDKNQLRRLLKELMPVSLINPFMESNKSLSVKNLSASLKDWRFKIVSYVGYRRAVVTAGGVSTDEIVVKSMQSKKEPRLFFAGEVINLDGDTGGYNLQIAFSTGSLAGASAAQQILKSI